MPTTPKKEPTPLAAAQYVSERELIGEARDTDRSIEFVISRVAGKIPLLQLVSVRDGRVSSVMNIRLLHVAEARRALEIYDKIARTALVATRNASKHPRTENRAIPHSARDVKVK